MATNIKGDLLIKRDLVLDNVKDAPTLKTDSTGKVIAGENILELSKRYALLVGN